jgi:DNA-directed RNA polymerase specialized sigma24 family protein
MTIAHNLAVDRLRRETGATRPHLVLVDGVPEVVGDEDEPFMERDLAIRALSLALGRRAPAPRPRTSAG